MGHHILTLDGNNFSDMEGFYKSAYAILTKDLDWIVAHNFDALHDILYGGFGVYTPQDHVTLKWFRFSKSMRDLGREHSIAYYRWRAAALSGDRARYFNAKADDLEKGEGQTLIDTILEILSDHGNIRLETLD